MLSYLREDALDIADRSVDIENISTDDVAIPYGETPIDDEWRHDMLQEINRQSRLFYITNYLKAGEELNDINNNYPSFLKRMRRLSRPL